MARTRLSCTGILEAEDFPVADISNHLERTDTVVWVDFCGPSKDEADELAVELGLHELAVGTPWAHTSARSSITTPPTTSWCATQ